ncbi:MAG: hypothetical protein AMJ69_13135 [Gammaproteobacteria bacterium SG8_47]|nr:MAG: hypothetical protein AMJ69_13135 [Gammaproteobacteria bacterium SG8_47]
MLERAGIDEAVALMTGAGSELAAAVMRVMVPVTAAEILQQMAVDDAGDVLDQLGTAAAARVLRVLPRSARQPLLGELSDREQRRLRRQLTYPPNSVGTIARADVLLLPGGISVAEARHRVEVEKNAVSDPVLVIDESQRLLGAVSLRHLIRAASDLPLQHVVRPVAVSIPALTPLATVAEHPAWTTARQLPVIEGDGALIGVVELADLKQELKEHVPASEAADPFASLLQLAGLYWITFGELMTSLLSHGESDRRDER